MSLIKMIRYGLLADVHPDMEADYASHGWVRCDGRAAPPPAAVVDGYEPDDDKPADEIRTADASLVDIVDNRALPKLAELGIYSLEDLILAADADQELADKVPYLTAKSLAKALDAFYDAD